MAKKYKFNRYQSVYDPDLILYGLQEDGIQVQVDNVKYIEVSPDFKRVLRVRADGLKIVGTVTREY